MAKITRFLARIVVIGVLLSLKLAAILKTCVSVSAPHFDSLCFALIEYIGAADQLEPTNIFVLRAYKKNREILKFAGC
jgi:hypothetical protein